MPASTIDGMVGRGSLTVVHNRVYQIPGTPRSRSGEILSAVLACGDGAAAARRTSAELWGVVDLAGRGPEVVIPWTRRIDVPDGVVVLRARQLASGDVTTRGGIPRTTPAVTLIMLAGVLDDAPLEDAFDDMLRAGRVSPEHVLRRLERWGTTGREGAGRLLGIAKARVGVRPDGSRRQKRARNLLVGAGLPAPETEYEVRVGGRLLGRVDLAWPDFKVAVEFDGYQHHSGRSAWERGVVREGNLEDHGWIVRNCISRDLEVHPYRIITSVALALRERGAEI